MTVELNALAAEAANRSPGARAYTYALENALDASILIVEEGGQAFSTGVDIGSLTATWDGILAEAGYRPGMYSWWNAIPYGLDRPNTADDRGRGRVYLTKAVALHHDLHVMVSVGNATHQVTGLVRTDFRTIKVRSPSRTSGEARQVIVKAFIEARKHAYPLGF